MKNVRITNSIILLSVFFFTCKQIPSKKNIQKKTESIEKTKITNRKDTLKYPYIETNSLKQGFDKNLINTLPVKKGDTVLFRKWKTSNSDSIHLINKKVRLKTDKFVNFYKTGSIKFSTYKILIEDTSTNLFTDFLVYANHGTYKNPYRMDYINGFVRIKKSSNNLYQFEIYNPNSLGNYIYFTVNNNGINITKLEYIVNTKGRTKDYSYILDTLIPINSKNKFIDIKKLNEILRVDKNER